jgi:hypothetical protein
VTTGQCFNAEKISAIQSKSRKRRNKAREWIFLSSLRRVWIYLVRQNTALKRWAVVDA